MCMYGSPYLSDHLLVSLVIPNSDWQLRPVNEVFRHPVAPVGSITGPVHILCDVNLIEVVVNAMHWIVHWAVGVVDITGRISEMKSIFRLIGRSNALLMFWPTRDNRTWIAYNRKSTSTSVTARYVKFCKFSMVP